MEIKISTQQVLTILYIISWVIFVGLGIEAGGIIFNAVFTLLYKPEGAKHLWQLVDLSNLYQNNRGNYIVQVLLISIVVLMKAGLFYMIIKVLQDKKLNMSKPFSKEIGRFIFNLSYLSLGIGLFSRSGANYAAWLSSQGITMPDIESMRLGGADVWLFMGVILFVIAQIFKRGIEIQTENELTV